MKKFGKFERPPVAKATGAAAVKEAKSDLKSMLLRTYLTSLLSLVFCVTLFFGTSYAWFTSEVHNDANEIYVGSLKVGLYKVGLHNEEEKNLNGSEEKLFDNNIRWEPGYTALEKVSIVNEGDLAFKYVMTFTKGELISGTVRSEEYEAVAKYFDVWSFYHRDGNGPTATSYDQITKENGWDYAGNLADVLKNGLPVLQNNMVTTRYKNLAEGSTEPTNPGTTDGIPTTDTYTIALHMKEEVSDISIMGKILSLNVKLVAYQKSDADETDGFGRNVYDDIVPVNTAKELNTAMDDATKRSAATTKIVLFSDITEDQDVDNVLFRGGLQDGNGKKIENLDIATNKDNDSHIKNLNIKAIVLTLRGDAILENCNLSETSLKLDYLANGKTVKLLNCKLGDVNIENAVITIEDHVFKITGVENLEVNDAGMLAWSKP